MKEPLKQSKVATNDALYFSGYGGNCWSMKLQKKARVLPS